MPASKNKKPWDVDHEDWRLRLAYLRENPTYRQFWEEHGGERVRQALANLGEFYSKNNPGGVFEACKDDLKILDAFTIGLGSFGVIVSPRSMQKCLSELDPSSHEPPAHLSIRFFDPHPAVLQVNVEGVSSEISNFGWVKFEKEPNGRWWNISGEFVTCLKPSERLLKVDLTRNKTDLMTEFERFLDHVYFLRASDNVPKDLQSNYEAWQPDKSRTRKEAWEQLKVYQLITHKSMSIKTVAHQLGIKKRTADERYKKARQLIEELTPVTLPQKEAVIALPCPRCKKFQRDPKCSEKCKKLKDYFKAVDPSNKDDVYSIPENTRRSLYDDTHTIQVPDDTEESLS